MTQELIAAIVAALMSAFLLAAPKGIWRVTEKWKSEGAEKPSRLFIIVTRAVGVMFAACGVLLLLGALGVVDFV